MRHSKFSIIGIGILLSFSAISFAQQTPKNTVPLSVSQNCLLTQSGTIDFCPTYRPQVRDLNIKLSEERKKTESE